MPCFLYRPLLVAGVALALMPARFARAQDPSWHQPAFNSAHGPAPARDRSVSLPRTGGFTDLQLDVTALLEPPLPVPDPPPSPPRPLFSNGWTRDGFGGRPGGWR
jgi:hypothetical protein